MERITDELVDATQELKIYPEMWPLRKGETLSNHDWFPFYGHEFLHQHFINKAIMEDRRGDIGTAIILFIVAMREDPAGTLPDNDIDLASLAKFKTVEDWCAVRDEVLEGWVPVLVEDDRHAEPITRLGHPVLTQEVVQDMYKRKRGRDAARDVARLAVKKTRIRKKMAEIGVQEHIIKDDRALHQLAEHFEFSDLYVTPDNVRAAMIDVLGYGGDVTPIHGGRRK